MLILSEKKLFLSAGLGLLIICPVNVSLKTGLPQKSDKVSSANWRRHPKIKTVRDIVASVDAGIKRGTFKASTRKFDYCEPYEDTLRKSFADNRGVVRRYDNEGGSEDSSLTWRHYYDTQGRLRFVFITGGAANGTRLEHRIYFDENGERIREEHKNVKGPGYTFPEVWPDEQLVKSDPAKAFASAVGCKEIK